MINRAIYREFSSHLGKYPILALTGPRQSGKTTFLRNSFPKYRYLTLENPDNRNYALQDPKGFLKEFDKYVIFDEAQRAPELFSYLQGIVDQSGLMGQYILSGSQNFNLIEEITQSLAGRVGLFRMYPFDLTEMKKGGLLEGNKNKMIINGFYPAIYDRKISPSRYYQDYIDTYLKRDISQLVNIQDERLFTQFISLCAARSGQLINYNDLARDAGVSNTTVKNWLSILETSFVIFFLQPDFRNYSKRIIKSPKFYFNDTGLLCHLLKIKGDEISPTHSHYGHIFENYVVAEMLKQNYHCSQFRDYFFWRTSHGKEIDLLYRENEVTHLFEIKASSTIKPAFFKTMDDFEQISGETVKKTLLYGGDQNQNRTNYDVRGWDSIGT